MCLFQDCEEAISALIGGAAWEEALRLVSHLPSRPLHFIDLFIFYLYDLLQLHGCVQTWIYGLLLILPFQIYLYSRQDIIETHLKPTLLEGTINLHFWLL